MTNDLRESWAQRKPCSEGIPRLDAKGYLAAHGAFRDYSDQRQNVMGWFGQAALLEGICPSPAVLSVGAGGGDVDIALIRELGGRGPFAYDAIDPNRVALERFRERTGSLPPADARRVWMHHGPFESFEPGHRYDLIHFVHVIYSMSDLALAVEKAYRLLEDGGKIGIVCSTDEGVNRFKRTALAAIGCRDVGTSVPEAELLKALTSLEGTRMQLGMIPSRINVEPCLARLPVGDRILSFFLQCDFSALEPADQEAVLVALRRHCTGEPGSRGLEQPMLGITLTKERLGVSRRVALLPPGRRLQDDLADVGVSA